jgi:hypothetical protein
MDELPSAQEFMECVMAIECELMVERQAKQDPQGRLASLQTTTDSITDCCTLGTATAQAVPSTK